MQYITQLGVFDVDDIILSTFGGFLGILIFDLLIRNYSTNG
jgi:glycopeptide antibiotics resistance protein